MPTPDNPEQVSDIETDLTRHHNKSDPRDRARPGTLSIAQQQAALRALRHAGIYPDLVIDLRGAPTIVKKPEPPEMIGILKSPPQARVSRATNTDVDILLPQDLKRVQPRRDIEADTVAFNEKLATLNSQTSTKANKSIRVPRQSRFARLRERVGERFGRSKPVLRAVGTVALAGLMLLGGTLLTRGDGGEAMQTKQQAITTTTFEVATSTSTITISAAETAPVIDLSNQATANALGQLIAGNEIVRQQMGPDASETQIQAAQLQTLDLVAALVTAGA